MTKRPRLAPHARVFQDELQRLHQLGARAGQIAAIVALRARVDARTGDTRDGLASIARYAGMSESTARRAIQWLVDQGIVDEEPQQPVRGGPKGTAWAWPRRVRQLDDWGKEAITLSPSSMGRPRSVEELRAIKAAGGRI
jgi:hypothetical protein